MAKDVVISTSGLNCYGSRVLTSGIDLTQYQKNPVLLWMHRRGFGREVTVIGRMENLRIDGDRLIGTPVFDMSDEFAKQIASKWENNFLRMASAGIQIVETSDAPEHILQGQKRVTITRCKLEEVSIVDIGANDEALQLYASDENIMKLAAGEQCDHLPLLCVKENAEGTAPEVSDNQPNNNLSMNRDILQLLGLPESATEQDAVNALRLLKDKADKADSLQLASINALVDNAIAEKRITADQKAHFVNIGKAAGPDALSATLNMMRPQSKPNEVIQRTADQPGGDAPKTYAKLSEVPDNEIPKLKEQNLNEYVRLYKAEFGYEPSL